MISFKKILNEQERGEEEKKKALKTHRNFNYDITGTIRKILTR